MRVKRFLTPFSHLRQFMVDPIVFMSGLSQHAQTITSTFLGPKRFHFVFAPELIQEILIKRSEVYQQNRSIFDRIKPVTGEKGLVQLSGNLSHARRVQSAPFFSPEGLAMAASRLHPIVDEFIEQYQETTEIDVASSMTALTLKTALSIFLNLEKTPAATQLGNDFLQLNAFCGKRMLALFPLPLSFPTRNNLLIRQLQKQIRNTLHAMIKETPAQTLSVPQIFSQLPLSEQIDQCMTFLFAGHETLSSSLSFTLLLLAQHPNYQEKIAAGDEEITLAVYKESLRLYPPAYMLARETKAADQLGGVKLQQGDQVVIAIRELHRHPQYFASPHEFRPERFLGPLHHPFCFLPFGVGKKSCVGERLAYLEAKIILKKICQAFHLSTPQTEIAYKPLITLHPHSHQHLFLKRRGLKGET